MHDLHHPLHILLVSLPCLFYSLKHLHSCQDHISTKAWLPIKVDLCNLGTFHYHLMQGTHFFSFLLFENFCSANCTNDTCWHLGSNFAGFHALPWSLPFPGNGAAQTSFYPLHLILTYLFFITGIFSIRLFMYILLDFWKHILIDTHGFRR